MINLQEKSIKQETFIRLKLLENYAKVEIVYIIFLKNQQKIKLNNFL